MTSESGLTRREFVKGVSATSAGLLTAPALGAISGCSTDTPPRRPNIITIFADDLGFSDIRCFGGEISTPNLDALAAGGVRATQFYNTARCCPSRASLLTGLYAHEAGIGLLVYNDYGEGYRGNLNDRCVTTGQVLGSAGYETMFVGKWHAGHAPASRPEVRGFERVTGIYSHIDSYWKVLEDCDVYRDGELLIPAGEDVMNPFHPEEEFYTTDFFTDAALDYLSPTRLSADRPFYMHLCYNAPHFPLEAPDDLIEKYRGSYSAGWDELREEKFHRMREMGIIGPGQTLPRIRSYSRERRGGFGRSVVGDFLPAWNSLSGTDRRELDFRRAMYAAQVERLDQNIGRLVDRLRANGALDNTVILFFSDNGCSGETVPFGMNWGTYTSENYSEWKKEGGWSISQGQCWAGLSNTPLRRYKLFVHEGGISSPFIAHWPHGIHQYGEINAEQAFHIVDILPTLCELGGAHYPTEFGGRPILPARGQSMMPWLRNVRSASQERTLFWQHESCSAVRQGDWKLVTSDDRDSEAWELYSLTEDRSESENLIGSESARAREMEALWREWALDVNAMPFPEQRA